MMENVKSKKNLLKPHEKLLRGLVREPQKENQLLVQRCVQDLLQDVTVDDL